MFEADDEILGKLAVNVFTEIFKTTFKGLKTSKIWLSEKIKEHDFFKINAGKYVKKLKQRYDFMRVLGMSEPVSIRSIYVKVNILEKISSQQRKSINELSTISELTQRSFGNILKTVDGIEIINRYDKLIILGKPGCGKTTFLKNILLQSIDGNLKDKLIPVFISLKSFSETTLSLIEYITEEFDICGFPEPELFIENILKKGNFLVLLDGLDEVNKEDSSDVILQIKHLYTKYSKNKYIISCRIAAYNYLFENFKDVEIADFQNRQIQDFVTNWFSKDKNASKLCLAGLEANPPIKELGTNPLLLTLLCIAFEQTLDFPANRSELYKESIDALLKKWDSTRGIKRDEIYRYLSPKRKESMFARIAASSFEKNQYFFKQNELEKYIGDFIQNLPQSKDEQLLPDSEVVLQSIESQHGIFVERSKNIYSFSHLTIQEYFTAKYIIDHFSKGTLDKLIESHLTDSSWREVFLITTEMLDEADDFLIYMRNRIHNLTIEDYSFIEYLSKIDELLNSNNFKLSNFSRILFVIMLMEVTKKQEYNNTIMLLQKGERIDDILMNDFNSEEDLNDIVLEENFITDLCYDAIKNSKYRIEKFVQKSNQVRSRRNFYEKRQEENHYNGELEIAIKKAFKIGINRFEFTPSKKKNSYRKNSPEYRSIYSNDENVDNFFTASTLLLDCLSTDCYVTKETRNYLIKNLFTIKKE